MMNIEDDNMHNEDIMFIDYIFNAIMFLRIV